MIINVLKCGKCGDKIFSRARHDYRCCSCNSISVDGGHTLTKDFNIFTYERYGFKDVNDVIKETIELNITEKELYDDWNNRIDKYGVIKSDRRKNSKK